MIVLKILIPSFYVSPRARENGGLEGESQPDDSIRPEARS